MSCIFDRAILIRDMGIHILKKEKIDLNKIRLKIDMNKIRLLKGDKDSNLKCVESTI